MIIEIPSEENVVVYVCCIEARDQPGNTGLSRQLTVYCDRNLTVTVLTQVILGESDSSMIALARLSFSLCGLDVSIEYLRKRLPDSNFTILRNNFIPYEKRYRRNTIFQIY